VLGDPFWQKVQRLRIKAHPVDDHRLRQRTVAGCDVRLIFECLVNRLNHPQPVHNAFNQQCSAYLYGSIFNLVCLDWHTLTSTVNCNPVGHPAKPLNRGSGK
jgi:hypothetical protein